MSGVVIADLAAVSALGDSLDATWARLCAGERAIGPVTRFDCARLDFRAAACVADLGAAGEEGEAFPNRTCALLARCLGRLRPVARETVVIWAGVKGDAEWVERRACGDGGEIEAFYAPAHYRRWIAERLGTGGAGFEVNAACASSTAALALGAMMIERGEADSVLVCAADLVTRFTFTGFAALKGLTATTCRPLDAGRDGLALGDGAAAALLMSAEAARAQGRAPLARLTGWGVANDATHITAPARDGCGLIAAMRQALGKAGRAPEAIDAFCVHGTGTVYNDAMELTALEAVFGERRFPIFSVKGAIGHTLGAAGALEAALCVKALQERRVPPTAGLEEPEARALGRASAGAQAMGGGAILTTNSGFGGVNAALVIERDGGER